MSLIRDYFYYIPKIISQLCYKCPQQRQTVGGLIRKLRLYILESMYADKNASP